MPCVSASDQNIERRKAKSNKTGVLLVITGFSTANTTPAMRCGASAMPCATSAMRCAITAMPCATSAMRCVTTAVRCGTDAPQCDKASLAESFLNVNYMKGVGLCRSQAFKLGTPRCCAVPVAGRSVRRRKSGRFLHSFRPDGRGRRSALSLPPKSL